MSFGFVFFSFQSWLCQPASEGAEPPQSIFFDSRETSWPSWRSFMTNVAQRTVPADQEETGEPEQASGYCSYIAISCLVLLSMKQLQLCCVTSIENDVLCLETTAYMRVQNLRYCALRKIKLWILSVEVSCFFFFFFVCLPFFFFFFFWLFVFCLFFFAMCVAGTQWSAYSLSFFDAWGV